MRVRACVCVCVADMLCAAPQQVSASRELSTDYNQHAYLSQEGTKLPSSWNDATAFEEMDAAMRQLGVSDRQRELVYTFFAAVVHLGDLSFGQGTWPAKDGGDAQPGSRVMSVEKLATAARLLQVEPLELETAVCTKPFQIPGEGAVNKPLEEKAALQQRNSLAMHLYSLSFDWCVTWCNETLSRETSEACAVGLVNFFGFENFDNNSFAQLCINLANERLHALFIEHVMELEQQVYVREDISWKMVDYETNKATIQLSTPSAIAGRLLCCAPLTTSCSYRDVGS